MIGLQNLVSYIHVKQWISFDFYNIISLKNSLTKSFVFHWSFYNSLFRCYSNFSSITISLHIKVPLWNQLSLNIIFLIVWMHGQIYSSKVYLKASLLNIKGIELIKRQLLLQTFNKEWRMNPNVLRIYFFKAFS